MNFLSDRQLPYQFENSKSQRMFFILAGLVIVAIILLVAAGLSSSDGNKEQFSASISSVVELEQVAGLTGEYASSNRLANIARASELTAVNAKRTLDNYWAANYGSMVTVENSASATEIETSFESAQISGQTDSVGKTLLSGHLQNALNEIDLLIDQVSDPALIAELELTRASIADHLGQLESSSF